MLFTFQDIDLSPAFTIFLSTRDPTVEFPPDICSRVTFVNFTVTRSSLQSQCLNQVLKAERPDIDDKRSNLLKLQGENLYFLRHSSEPMQHYSITHAPLTEKYMYCISNVKYEK